MFGAVMTEERLAAFGEAWNARDADLVMSFMADDCLFHASVGPDLLGRTYAGAGEVRRGVQAFFDRYPDGRFDDGRVFVAGDHGASEWTFSWTGEDGERVAVRGCDLFEFDGDLIKVKNAFRKNPPRNAGVTRRDRERAQTARRRAGRCS